MGIDVTAVVTFGAAAKTKRAPVVTLMLRTSTAAPIVTLASSLPLDGQVPDRALAEALGRIYKRRDDTAFDVSVR